MTNTKIIKQDDIELSGSLQLNCPTVPNAPARQQVNQVVTKPQVQIVEKTNEFAVIQVTCSCGKTTNVKCEYI
jgi:hypothetical protein